MTWAPRAPRREPKGAPAWLVWRSVARALLPALLVVVAPATVGFLLSDYFTLREVVVRADSPSLAEEVASLLEVPEQANTVVFPLQELVGQAERAPRVLRVRASRDLPSRILLRIEERQPSFALRDEQGFVMVDEEGVLLFRTGKPGPETPVIAGIVSGERALGARLSPECLGAVLDCMAGARTGGVGLSFALDLETPYDYRLVTPSGTLVKLGGPDNLARKVIAAGAIERHLEKRGARAAYIDVRVAGRPAYKEMR